MNDPVTKQAGFSPRGGVVVRNDLTLYVWCDDDGIEVVLNPEQAIALALSLLETTGGALTRARKEAEVAKCLS